MTKPNTTYEDLHEYLGTMLGEPYGTYNRWTLATRNLWLNKGIQKVAELLRCCTTTETINSLASTATYDLTVSGTLTYKILDIDEEKGVRYNDDRLTKKTVDQMDVYDPDWRDAISGVPTHYLFNYGTKELRMYPPVETALTDGIEVNYVYLPDTISDVSTSPDLPEEKRYAAACWAAWKLFGSGRRKMSQANEWKKEFIEEMKTHLSNEGKNADGISQMTSYINNYANHSGKYTG